MDQASLGGSECVGFLDDISFRDSMVSGGDTSADNAKQPGMLSGIGTSITAFFANAGKSLRSLFSSAREGVKNAIPGSSSLPSLNSAFSSASKSLSSLVKGFSFKTPTFMTSKDNRRSNDEKILTEDTNGDDDRDSISTEDRFSTTSRGSEIQLDQLRASEGFQAGDEIIDIKTGHTHIV